MSEKLTVAELLARNGRESADSTTSRPRRRRRNLEEGGVSVAELTGSIPVITQKDVDADKAREKREADAEVPTELGGEKVVSRKVEKPSEITGEMKTVSGSSARDAESALVSAPQQAKPEQAQPKLEEQAPEKAEQREEEAAPEQLTEAEKPEAESGAHPASDEFAALEASLGDDEIIEYEDNTISWPVMIAQALGAIVAGIGVFYGFSLLWGNLSPIIVAFMALAVTLLLVGLVHALLRHKDKLLMALAFVVGIVLTFGPRLIIGL